MVGKIVKLFSGYRFYISDGDRNWVSKKIYSNANQAHTIMVSVMEFGLFSEWTVEIGLKAEKEVVEKAVLV